MLFSKIWCPGENTSFPFRAFPSCLLLLPVGPGAFFCYFCACSFIFLLIFFIFAWGLGPSMGIFSELGQHFSLILRVLFEILCFPTPDFFKENFVSDWPLASQRQNFPWKTAGSKKNVEKKAKVRVWLPAQDWVLIFWPSLQTFVRGCVLDINNTSSFFSHLAMLFQDPLTAFGNAGHKFVSRDVITDCLLCLLLESFKGIVWIPKFAQLCLCPWPHILLGIQIRRMRWIFWKRFDTKLPQSLFCLWRMKHLLAVKQYLEGLPVWESRPQEWAQTSPDNFCKCCRSPFFLAHGD